MWNSPLYSHTLMMYVLGQRGKENMMKTVKRNASFFIYLHQADDAILNRVIGDLNSISNSVIDDLKSTSNEPWWEVVTCGCTESCHKKKMDWLWSGGVLSCKQDGCVSRRGCFNGQIMSIEYDPTTPITKNLQCRAVTAALVWPSTPSTSATASQGSSDDSSTDQLDEPEEQVVDFNDRVADLRKYWEVEVKNTFIHIERMCQSHRQRRARSCSVDDVKGRDGSFYDFDKLQKIDSDSRF